MVNSDGRIADRADPRSNRLWAVLNFHHGRLVSGVTRAHTCAMRTQLVAHGSRLGEKGRIVVPAEVRRAAGLTADSEVVIRAEGEGRVVIETADAARKRVWAAAPSPGADATADVRAMREEDTRISDGNAAARAHSATGTEEEAGQQLLEALGL